MKAKKSTTKKDCNLVVNGKYNFKAIMQRAWAYLHNNTLFYANTGYTMKQALKDAWYDAKGKMEEYLFEKSGTPLFPEKELSLSAFYSDPKGNLAMGYVAK